MKLPHIDKTVALPDYLEMLITSDEEVDKLHNYIFTELVKRFKYFGKTDKFNIEEQKKAIKLDAEKLLKYYHLITTENPELLNSEE